MTSTIKKAKKTEAVSVFGGISGEAHLILRIHDRKYTKKKIMDGIESEELEVLPPDDTGWGAINTDGGGHNVAEFKLAWTGDPVSFEVYPFGN